MKYVFVIASLLFVQASALAQDRANPVNYGDPALNTATAKRDCWKRHSTGGDTSQPRLIRANAEAPTQTLEKTARSLRTI
jgi:hypothetical protein